jgi:predicted acylesterase/phospholipase RssA
VPLYDSAVQEAGIEPDIVCGTSIGALVGAAYAAGEPADVVIRPMLADIAAMDFHRAAPAIGAGRKAAEQALGAIHEVLSVDAGLGGRPSDNVPPAS